FVFTRSLVVLDSLHGRARVVVSVPVPRGTPERDLQLLYERAAAELDDILNRLRGPARLEAISPDLRARAVEGHSSYERADVMTRHPIAGTPPRGKTAEQDEKLSADLLADEKERAEHVMLVDLGRNDVGRVAKYGTVKVTELMKVETYSHVLHIVSQVEGELNDGLTALDVFRATFPAGTMTGAPKIRAMEIIDELEPVSRGPYAGAIGYIAAGGGRMDLAITIRTCVIADGAASVQAGAGVVAAS